MELNRLVRWKPAERFCPLHNDMIFINKSISYTMETRVSLIVKWRVEAERAAVNAILLMMLVDKDTLK